MVFLCILLKLLEDIEIKVMFWLGMCKSSISEIDSRKKFLDLDFNVLLSFSDFKNFLKTAFALCTTV